MCLMNILEISFVQYLPRPIVILIISVPILLKFFKVLQSGKKVFFNLYKCNMIAKVIQ